VGDSEVYLPSQDGALRQGEVISGLVQIRLGLENGFPGPDDEHAVIRIEHSLALVVSQDCDLDWDYKNRSGLELNPQKEMPNTLFCEVAAAAELRGLEGINASIWGKIKTNKDERYQFLQRIPRNRDAAGEGLPELALDFKRCFTIPTEEVYRQLRAQGRRRCRLASPYLEHLSDRLFNYHARVALPTEHMSEPEPSSR